MVLETFLRPDGSKRPEVERGTSGIAEPSTMAEDLPKIISIEEFCAKNRKQEYVADDHRYDKKLIFVLIRRDRINEQA